MRTSDCRLPTGLSLVFSVIGFAAASAIAGPASLLPEPWQQLGPAGVTVSALATVPGFPDDVFLVTQGQPARVYYTSNAGLSWTMRDTIADRICALAVDPQQVTAMYCAGWLGKVYRSTDFGRSWHVRSDLGPNVRVRQLAVNTANRAEIWATANVTQADSAGLAVFKSSDSGSTWTRTVLGAGHEADAVLLAIDAARPNRIFAGGTVNNRPKVNISTDAGTTWSGISSGLAGACAFGISPGPRDSILLVCGTDSGIYRSTNSGLTWSLRKAAPAWSVAFTPAAPHYCYAGSDNLVFRSNDNGLNWSAETTQFSGTNTRWLGLNPVLPLEFYAGNGAGIFHTTNGGFNWASITAGFRSLSVPFLYFLPAAQETMFTCPPGCGIIRSTDRGNNWHAAFRRFPGSGFATGLAQNPHSADTVAVVTGFDSRFHLSADRGDSWIHYQIAGHFTPLGLRYHPNGPDTAYVWGAQRDSASGPAKFALFKSTSRGQTWTTLLKRGSQGRCLGFELSASCETLYAYGSVDRAAALYRSANRGGNWSTANTGITGAAVRDFASSPADPATFFCATSDGVFRSRDRTLRWTGLGLKDVAAVLPDTASVNAVACGTDTQAVFYTTNAGVIWQRDTIGFASRTVLFLKRLPQSLATIYCGTAGASILGRGLIGIAEPNFGLRTSNFELLVRPSLARNRIQLTLGPGEGRTVLELFRPDGRLAWKAELEPTPASWAWTRPAGLAPGAYLLVARSGAGRRVAKVVLAE